MGQKKLFNMFSWAAEGITPQNWKNTKACFFFAKRRKKRRLSKSHQYEKCGPHPTRSGHECTVTIWYNNLLLGLSITFLIKHLYVSFCIYSSLETIIYIRSLLQCVCVCRLSNTHTSTFPLQMRGTIQFGSVTFSSRAERYQYFTIWGCNIPLIWHEINISHIKWLL